MEKNLGNNQKNNMAEINNNKKNIIGIIVQAGAVGIALIAIYFLYDLASNHINDNTKILIKLESAINKSTEVDQEQIRVLGDLERTIQINLNK